AKHPSYEWSANEGSQHSYRNLTGRCAACHRVHGAEIARTQEAGRWEKDAVIVPHEEPRSMGDDDANPAYNSSDGNNRCGDQRNRDEDQPAVAFDRNAERAGLFFAQTKSVDAKPHQPKDNAPGEHGGKSYS